MATGDKEAGHHHSLRVRRTKSWYNETDQKLSILVRRVCVLVTSEGWRVRLGMVSWAYTILSHCHR